MAARLSCTGAAKLGLTPVTGSAKAAPVIAAVAEWCRRTGRPEPATEHRFHPVRRWRFDLAWPAEMIAVEIHGGNWSGGRHTRGQGFENDCEKMSHAAALGWRVLPVTYRQANRGDLLAWLETAFNYKHGSE